MIDTWPCCMCKTHEDLRMVQNPFGDMHVICKSCVPAFNKMWVKE
mgnify:CR=1 FL=1